MIHALWCRLTADIINASTIFKKTETFSYLIIIQMRFPFIFAMPKNKKTLHSLSTGYFFFYFLFGVGIVMVFSHGPTDAARQATHI